MIAGGRRSRGTHRLHSGIWVADSWALTLNLQPQQMGFDPRKDYAPVSLVGETQYVSSLILISALILSCSGCSCSSFEAGRVEFLFDRRGQRCSLGTLMIAKKLGIEMTHVPIRVRSVNR